MNAAQIISEAFHSYYYGWDGFGLHSGVGLAIVEDLVCAGLVVDDVIGEASIEARVMRVLDEHVLDNDGRVNEDEFAGAVARELGLEVSA